MKKDEIAAVRRKGKTTANRRKTKESAEIRALIIGAIESEESAIENVDRIDLLP